MRRAAFSLAIVFGMAVTLPAQESHQATGVKVGELTADSAVVWMRLTAKPLRVPAASYDFKKDLPEGTDINTLGGACPGAPGQVRLRYGLKEDLSDAVATVWTDVDQRRDFAHQFRLAGLKPASTYYYAAETAGPGGAPQHRPLRGEFRTAPPPDAQADVLFTVTTCQAIPHLDHPDGFHIYEAMAKLKPCFDIPTGDTVYYDSDTPHATTIALARYHWQRMCSLPRHVEFFLHVPAYWEKDDHDTVFNDCWPTMKPKFQGDLTFAAGQRIFLEQVPMGDRTFRTFRWGKGLQIWLTEGRDFRSPNNMPDGPEKTILGAEQKKWLLDGILQSDADWKVWVSPTALVGPDRKGKADNHANAAFATEGNELRRWFAEHVPHNFFVCCGDRHWQYESIHPETKVHEFDCGPASDVHAGGTPGENKQYHRFHRVAGGFLSVAVTYRDGRSTIAFRHHDVYGKVLNTYEQTQGQPGAK